MSATITVPSPIISLNLGPHNPGNTPVRDFFSGFMPTWPGSSGNFAINFPYYKLQSGQRVFDNRIAFTKESLTAEYRRVNGLASGASVSDSDLQTYWNSVTKIKVKFAYYGHFGTAKGVYSGYDAWVTESRSPHRTPISGTIKIEGTNTNVTAQTLLSGSIVFPTASEYSAMQAYQREYAGALFSDNIEYEINVPDGANDNFWLDVNSGDHISSVGGAGNSTLDGAFKGVIMGNLNIDFPEARGYALMSNEEDYEISTEQFVPILVSYTTPMASASASGTVDVTVRGMDASHNTLATDTETATFDASKYYKVNVNAIGVDHWGWSIDGGSETMMPAGSTHFMVNGADYQASGGTGSTIQLPNLTTPIECDHGFGENAIFNTGKGFSSVSAIEALIPRYPGPSRQFLEDGADHQWMDTIIYGASQSLPELVELDSEGKITKFCLANSGIDYQEDDDGPGYHYLYIFSNPLSLWVKAGTDGSKSATASPDYENSGTRWNQGWVTNNWGTTAPDLTKNHAIIRYWPNSE